MRLQEEKMDENPIFIRKCGGETIEVTKDILQSIDYD